MVPNDNTQSRASMKDNFIIIVMLGLVLLLLFSTCVGLMALQDLIEGNPVTLGLIGYICIPRAILAIGIVVHDSIIVYHNMHKPAVTSENLFQTTFTSREAWWSHGFRMEYIGVQLVSVVVMVIDLITSRCFKRRN